MLMFSIVPLPPVIMPSPVKAATGSVARLMSTVVQLLAVIVRVGIGQPLACLPVTPEYSIVPTLPPSKPIGAAVPVSRTPMQILIDLSDQTLKETCWRRSIVGLTLEYVFVNPGA